MKNKIYFNEGENSLEKQRREMTVSLAKLIHEEWQQTRAGENGSREPRFKEVKDVEWIEKSKGSNEVDIANTEFDDLPGDWQEENILSAKVAVEKIEDVLNLVHDKWLDRNNKTAEDEQKTQFSRLPKKERLKDIAILKKALEIMENNN